MAHWSPTYNLISVFFIDFYSLLRLTNEWYYATKFSFSFSFSFHCSAQIVANTIAKCLSVISLSLSLSLAPSLYLMLFYVPFVFTTSYCDFISFINGKQNIKIKRLNREINHCCYVIQLNWFHENRPQIKQTKKQTQSKLVRDVTWKKKEQGKSTWIDSKWIFMVVCKWVGVFRMQKPKNREKNPNETKGGYWWLHKLCVCVYLHSSMIFNRT